MSEYLEQLNSLQEKLEKNKTEKVRIEERIKNLKEESGKLELQLKELNIASFAEAKTTAEKLETEIKDEIEKAELVLK